MAEEKKDFKSKFLKASNDFKKKATTKRILSATLFLFLFSLVITLTFVPVIFDIENLVFSKWLTQTLISMGIMIGGIVLGEMVGDDLQKDKVDGLYQTSLKGYTDLLNLLIELKIKQYFSQFYVIFKAKELKIAKEEYLCDMGIDQQQAHQIVKYCSLEDIETLKTTIVSKVDSETGETIDILDFSDNLDKLEFVKDIFDPKFVLKTKPYNYYLNAFSRGGSRSILEVANSLDKREKGNKIFRRTFKILISVIISLIIGTATVSDSMGNAQTMAINLISRLVSLFGGLLSGYMTSVMSVKLEALRLDNKKDVLQDFKLAFDSKDFIAKDYNDLVKERKEKLKEN